MRLNEGGDSGYTNKLKEYLGDIGENAFKNLKVGDFQAGLGESLIFTAEEVRRHPTHKKPNLKNHCETTFSLATQGSEYIMYGKIAVGSHGAGALDTALTVESKRHGRIVSWRFEEILSMCSGFYVQRFKEERDLFYTLGNLPNTAKRLQPIEPQILKHEQNSMLLRLGHYSHLQCMTVKNNNPKIKPTADGILVPSRTRTLADGIFPFGWARLSVCSEEEYREALAAREAQDRAFVEVRERRVREIQESRERQARARLETERRVEQERRAAEQATAELEALSPEERLLLLVTRGQGNDNQVQELFGKLDAMAPDLQRRAAAALKALWISESKWSKNVCSKKQWPKVTKLKAILGEA